MKICVAGTHCVGKSTYIKDFLQKWSMYKSPEKSYRDLIKEKNLNINENGDEESQKIILNALIDQVTPYSKDDNVIFDRSVLDNLAYTTWLALNGKVSEKFLDETRTIVMQTLKLYDIIFFFPLTKFSKIEIQDDGIRSTDPLFREEIDNIFKAFQESYHKGDGKIFPRNDCPAMIEIYGSPLERIMLTSLYLREDGDPYKEEESLIQVP